MTKMKKDTINYDREIDDFLKCNHGNIEFKWEDKTLASQIRTKAKRSSALIKFSRFALPLAACLVALIGWQTKDETPSANEVMAQSLRNEKEAYFVSDLSSKDLELLDDWLLVSPGPLDFLTVDYDTSYELLVSLETIPLP